MTDPGRWRDRFRASPADVAGLVAFVAGLLLAFTVHIGFLLLAGLGALGPELLREANVLDDKDELQRESAAHAGHRAFLVGALVLVLAIVSRSWGRLYLDEVSAVLLAVLAVMLLVYLGSYVARYWNGRRAAFWILVAFGLLWLAFVLLSHGGDPEALAIEALVVPMPFLFGAYLSRRWPRPIGVLLLVVAAAMAVFFGVVPLGGDFDTGEAFLGALLILPLVVAALGLLSTEPDGAGLPAPGSGVDGA